jgi:hypothetical protein
MENHLRLSGTSSTHAKPVYWKGDTLHGANI